KAGVSVIFTSGEAATLAAKSATQTIPIVFTLVGDPVAAGVVKSLAQPEANVTGVSSLTTDLVPKRLEALKTLSPQLRRPSAAALGMGCFPRHGLNVSRGACARRRGRAAVRNRHRVPRRQHPGRPRSISRESPSGRRPATGRRAPRA